MASLVRGWYGEEGSKEEKERDLISSAVLFYRRPQEEILVGRERGDAAMACLMLSSSRRACLMIASKGGLGGEGRGKGLRIIFTYA